MHYVINLKIKHEGEANVIGRSKTVVVSAAGQQKAIAAARNQLAKDGYEIVKVKSVSVTR